MVLLLQIPELKLLRRTERRVLGNAIVSDAGSRETDNRRYEEWF